MGRDIIFMAIDYIYRVSYTYNISFMAQDIIILHLEISVSYSVCVCYKFKSTCPFTHFYFSEIDIHFLVFYHD